MRVAVRTGCLATGTISFDDKYVKPSKPGPKSRQALVRVHAAGINPVDYKVGKAILGPVVGCDFAGVIEALPDGSKDAATGLKIGDLVYGSSRGTLADYLLADLDKVARMPTNYTFVQAASLPVAYLTGLQALRDHGQLKEGGRVLIIGASGGTGLAGVQLARALGASLVVGVCSARNQEVVERCGAHRVLDYNKEKVSDVFGSLPDAEKFDVVYDCASGSGYGENYEAESWSVLKATGHYVPIAAPSACAGVRFALGCQKARMHLFLAKMNTPDFEVLVKLIEEHGIEPLIASTFQLSAQGVADGFAMLKGRRTVGKIVFEIKSNLLSTASM